VTIKLGCLMMGLATRCCSSFQTYSLIQNHINTSISVFYCKTIPRSIEVQIASETTLLVLRYVILKLLISLPAGSKHECILPSVHNNNASTSGVNNLEGSGSAFPNRVPSFIQVPSGMEEKRVSGLRLKQSIQIASVVHLELSRRAFDR